MSVKIYVQQTGKTGKFGKKKYYGPAANLEAAAEKLKANIEKAMYQSGAFGIVKQEPGPTESSIIITACPACMLFEKTRFLVTVVPVENI